MGKAGLGYPALAVGLLGALGLYIVAWRQPQLLSIDQFNGWYTFAGIMGAILVFFAFVGDWGTVVVGLLAALSVPAANLRLPRRGSSDK